MNKHLCTDCQQWRAPSPGERCDPCHLARIQNIAAIAAEAQREALGELDRQRGSRHGK